MKNRAIPLILLLFNSYFAMAQDTTVQVEEKMIQLSEVVVRANLDVPKFILQVKNDTSFYKAFRNLRILGFTALNDVRIMDKNGNVKASLNSKTRQQVAGGCRTMQVLEEQTTGDMYDKDRHYNYYTAEMYAGLVFTFGKVCGENNIVAGREFSTSGKTGMAKHKEQLKMLFFNPGKKIPGIPFIGDRIAIFEPERSGLYDFIIDLKEYQGQECYVFTVKAKAGLSSDDRDDVVINEMTTWFNYKTFDIVAREYDLSYNAGVYDFDVHMEVQMTRYKEYLVPNLIRYNGNWDVVFKKRERGVFTATLFDFGK
jgi:hypothetical protein